MDLSQRNMPMMQTGISPDLASGAGTAFWRTIATPMTGTETVWKSSSFPARPGYAYDALNQLVKAEYPTYGEELFYDRAGNRTRRRSAGVEEVYAYDAGNHLTKLTRNGEDISFQYDRAGNLLNDDRATYSYDAFNRQTAVETFDGNIQINHYDAEGLRHEMEENGKLVQFIFNPAKEVVTETEDRTVLRYIRGSELIARNTDAVRTYYHYASDEMGSITHVTDEEGNPLNRYEYDAWGNRPAEERAGFQPF